MWYDEILTFYMTQLPSMSAVWAALKVGVDLNPPLFYLATANGVPEVLWTDDFLDRKRRSSWVDIVEPLVPSP